MPTLDQDLVEISHSSALLRRARLLGLTETSDFIRVAVARGCRHYAPAYPPSDKDPGKDAISDEELVALLLLGSNEYNAIAIRCAAQLAGDCDIRALVAVSLRERIGRPLAYIAMAGERLDAAHTEFWKDLVERLGPQRPVNEGVLPHWSRFVLQTGITARFGKGEIQWLRRG